MKNTEGVPRGRGLAAPESEYPMVLLCVSVCKHSNYWLSGATLGGIFGNLITFSTKGLDFVMTSMFVVIFVEQWLKDKSHVSAILGIVLSVVSLLLFGPENFVIPAMIMMLLALTALRPKLGKLQISKSEVEHKELTERETTNEKGGNE